MKDFFYFSFLIIVVSSCARSGLTENSLKLEPEVIPEQFKDSNLYKYIATNIKLVSINCESDTNGFYRLEMYRSKNTVYLIRNEFSNSTSCVQNDRNYINAVTQQILIPDTYTTSDQIIENTVFLLNDVLKAPYTTSVATSYNLSSAYGYTDWSNQVFKSILDLGATADPDYLTYNLLYLNFGCISLNSVILQPSK